MALGHHSYRPNEKQRESEQTRDKKLQARFSLSYKKNNEKNRYDKCFWDFLKLPTKGSLGISYVKHLQLPFTITVYNLRNIGYDT